MNIVEVKRLYKKYKTPKHVVAHCEKVAYVAQKIAQEFLRKGIEVDVKSLRYAALLHDLLKVIDFKSGGEYSDVQATLRKKYPELDHSQAAYKLLNEIGEHKTANMIRKHAFEAIIDELSQPFTLEEKIMTYADKRVLHDKIVSLKERFEDGKKRYNPNNKNKAHQNKIYKAYFNLEEELFKNIEISPQDIK